MFCRSLFCSVILSALAIHHCSANDHRETHHHHGAVVQSQNHQPHNQRFRRELPIVHFGYGYVYDPYARGTFEIQDPLKDPLFQAQHKFDSHFPGRYTPQQKRQYQKNVWKLFQR